MPEADLATLTTAIFQNCPGTIGKVPKEFKSRGFWIMPKNDDILKRNEASIRQYAVLGQQQKRLVSESIEGDVDTYLQKHQGILLNSTIALAFAVQHAFECLEKYLEPEELEALCEGQTALDKALMGRASGTHTSADLGQPTAQRSSRRAHHASAFRRATNG